MNEATLSRTLTTPQRVLHDARAIADACAASTFSSDPARVRAVLRTSPAERSGSGPAGGDLRYEGTYEVLCVLSGRPSALSGQYSWLEPRVEHRGVTGRDIYDPFALPGVVTCRYEPGGPGAPFGEIRLLPEGWHVHAAEAELAPSAPQLAAARRWLRGPNDLLFARAICALARAGELTAALLARVRAQAFGDRRAVAHFVTLTRAPRLAGMALAADLASGSDPGHRRAAAVGLLAARLFTAEATTAAVVGWPPAMTTSGLLDPALNAGDDYVREAFSLLTRRRARGSVRIDTL